MKAYAILAFLVTALLGAPAFAGDNNATEQKTFGDILAGKIMDRTTARMFSSEEKGIIRDFFAPAEKYESKHTHKKDKKKKNKGLPPGLAKKDRLPPGLEKQLRKNGHLPPGLEKRALPSDLARRLPS